MTSPWKRLAGATLLALGMAPLAMAQDASGIAVTPLHTFTGIGGAPAAGANPETSGQGANPNAPPIHDAATGLLIGATHKGGNGATTGVVYTLPVETSEQSFASVNAATNTTSSVNSPSPVAGEPGQFYLGVGSDFYQYAPDSANAPSRTQIVVQPLIQAALTELGDASPAGGVGFGQWAYGTVGGLPPSLYFVRSEYGGTSAYNLWRYDAQAETMHRLHKWPGLGTIQGGSLQAPSALPAALGWLYVSEGSTLGAAFLFKEAQDKLGLSESFGARNLAAYPQGRARAWKDFVQALDTSGLTETEQKLVIDGANQAYERFGQLLTRLYSL